MYNKWTILMVGLVFIGVYYGVDAIIQDVRFKKFLKKNGFRIVKKRRRRR